MNRITTVLFDFDGVVADTEPLYDRFWDNMAKDYHIDIPHFSAIIKGTTLPSIFATYFNDYSPAELQQIAAAITEYESRMSFPEVPGAIHFLHRLKEEGYKVGLVTSSSTEKMKIALKKMGLEDVFDALVTADRISRGKPDPMCYLLAAEELGVQPSACIVFEDSFSGIQSGCQAGMRVIGVATTHPAEKIRAAVYAVISDFRDESRILDYFKL
ncbi:HAD family phosphatase [Odoribacter sp. Z80]|uniref:HAD family hydrolase n=1 Tax=Odoribacter sp. Z80 TaxID=2304575 RepID=UPI0013796F1A|nr:HAD family phosphatase [Odoribacter sp. Z80]NCE72279.1 HAD family phosphatase [Odoribacter sp. Z80]